MPIYKTKNENFFKHWSPEMAYVLGFFAADGCMMKNKRGSHFIEFQITDEDILLKIRKLLKSNHKIIQREEKNNWKTRYRLQIGSKEIFNDLSSLGFTPNKTRTLEMPVVPKKYFKDFVRGYFDGDGNVYVYKRKDRDGKLSLLAGFTCGSKHFLEKLLVGLKEMAKIKGGTMYCRKETYYCLYFSVRDSIGLYKLMYDECEKLCLLRKKKVFERFIKTR